MSNTEATFIDENGQVRLAGQIGAPNASAAQVLTADGAGSTSFEDAGGGLPDPITSPVTIAPTTPGDTPLTVDYSQGDGVTFSVSGSGEVSWAGLSGDQRLLDIQDANFNDVLVVRSVGSVNEIGFFGHAESAQPVVPMTVPVVQDVIDALIALGLVAQHD